MDATRRWWGWTVGVGVVGLLLAGCGAASTPVSGTASTPAAGATSTSVSASGAADTSTSKVSNVCSVVTTADLDAAFGGTWATMSRSAPLTCDFDLTANQSASALASGSAVEISLMPNGYAASGIGVAQQVAGLGEQAGLLGNTLFIKRGADVIVILTMAYDGSAKAQAALVALGKAIYPRF